MTAHESLLSTCTVLPLHLGTTFGKILFLNLSLQPYISCCPNILQHIMNTGPETNFLSSVLPGAQHRMGADNILLSGKQNSCGKKGWGNPLKCLCLGKTKKERKLNLITSSMKTYKNISFAFSSTPFCVAPIFPLNTSDTGEITSYLNSLFTLVSPYWQIKTMLE